MVQTNDGPQSIFKESAMLSAQTIATVKSTIPLLESAGTVITQHFYERMFRHNPELKNIFNMSNQHSGRQQFALFSAIAAYAKNIETPEVLAAAVERIAQKHTSLNVQADHYQIVGHHLIETLRELAPDAFTPKVEAAWTEAYTFLAGIFIGREGAIYANAKAQPGGWNGPRDFVVRAKSPESELVTSFILAPADGGPVLAYQPGQYLAVRVKPQGADYWEIRQYSLSDKSNGKEYRISVKREQGQLPGAVSNYLQDAIQPGDTLQVMPPAGDFFFKSPHTPNVFISAGVGVTPMMAMLESLVANRTSGGDHHPVLFLHACETPQQHSFASRIRTLEQQIPALKSFTWYASAESEGSFHGLMELAPLNDILPLANGNFYLCGPSGFMKFVKDQLLVLGVTGERIHYEVFGPHAEL